MPLDAWPKAAAYCRIVPVVAAEKKVRRRRADIVAAVDLGIGNGRVESINNKVKVTVRIGYGFSNIGNLVSLLMLRCSDLQPAMSWKDRTEEAWHGRLGPEGSEIGSGQGSAGRRAPPLPAA